MSGRLKAFSTEELSALLFSLDIATTPEPLVTEGEWLPDELIDELREHCPEPRRKSKIEPAHSDGLVLL
jgi:hypothetical protein